MSFINIKLLSSLEHSDEIYPPYKKCLINEVQSVSDYLSCVDEVKTANVATRLRLGVLGSAYFYAVDRGGNDEI